jgi:hypothetical protein
MSSRLAGRVTADSAHMPAMMPTTMAVHPAMGRDRRPNWARRSDLRTG